MTAPRLIAPVRGLRLGDGGVLGLALVCGACSAQASRLHVRLEAGPSAAPFDTPVHVL